MDMFSFKLKDSGWTQENLARALGVNQTTVSRWMQKEAVPAHRIIDVERITGIPREKLRPDLYTPRTGLIHKEEEEEAA